MGHSFAYSLTRLPRECRSSGSSPYTELNAPSCQLMPAEVLGLLTLGGDLIADENTSGVQMLALVAAADAADLPRAA
jgi:hypothetical protein